MRPVKVNCKRVSLIMLTISLVSLTLFYAHYTKVLHAGTKMHSWMKNKLSVLTWSNMHCKGIERWSKDSKWPPIQAVGKQLRIKDGQSVFVNGMKCGEWLDALHGVFPQLKLFGIDTHFGSVHHVKTIVNGTFDMRQPFDLLDLAPEYKSFEHALMYGVLAGYSQQDQCNAVTRLLPLIKPGGSLFIGSNFEDCDTADDAKKHLSMAGIKVLPKCFWSKICLDGRQDIAEVIYVTEETAYTVPHFHEVIKRCSSAVFIYKSIIVNKQRNKKPLYPSLRFPGQSQPHECTRSDFITLSKSHHEIKEGIKKAVKDMKLRGLDMH